MTQLKRAIEIDEFFSQPNVEEKIKFLLKFAVIAPSTHNTQPWNFKISNSSCSIFIDYNLLLPMADPQMRYLLISMGAALENLILAAKFFNVYDSHLVFDKFENGLFATVRFSNLDAGKINENLRYLIDSMLSRRNARGFFENEKISEELLEGTMKTLEKENYSSEIKFHFISDQNLIEHVAKATSLGLQKTYKDRNFRLEMSHWMNSNWTRKKDGMPGYTLRMPFLLSFILPTLIKVKDIGKKLGYLNFVSIKSAPLVCVVTAQAESEPVWSSLGQAFERVVLELIKFGYFPSVFVASIEAKTLDLQLLNIADKPQFLFVLGKPKVLTKFSPRYSVNEKLHE